MTNIIDLNKYREKIFFKELVPVQLEILQKYGWIIHHVIGEGSHTHGIYEMLGHPDIEIILNIDPNDLHGILWNAFRLLSQERIEIGKRYPRILQSMDVIFVKSNKNNTLRLIIPDENGNLEFDKIQHPYKTQYDNLP